MIASDFSKLLRFLQDTHGETLSTEQIQDILSQEKQQFSEVYLDFFRYTVVYESSTARCDGIDFIQHVLVPLMSAKEKSSFAIDVIENFLI
jgi:hypothetical protein